MAMTLVSTVTVGAGGTASILWTSIPQTGRDLAIVLSGRHSASVVVGRININADSNDLNYSFRRLEGNGSTAASTTGNTRVAGYLSTNGDTANTFSNSQIYFSNYTSSSTKFYTEDAVRENNGTTSAQVLISSQWLGASAITSLELTLTSGTFVQHTTASLYIIDAVGAAPKATGGSIYVRNGYAYHAFAASGTFTPTQAITADILVVGGGGGGATGSGTSGGGGGAGAGGVLYLASQSLTAQNYTVTVGAGGAAHSAGSDTSFGGLGTAGGGGYGGGAASGSGGDGRSQNGSGGGGGGLTGNTAAGTSAPSSGGGNPGGTGDVSDGGGGGGGAGASGQNGSAAAGGNGGAGTSSYSSILSIVGLGELVSGTYRIAGGGGGAPDASGESYGSGGAGGGGYAGNVNGGMNGMANTGGGGGGTTSSTVVGGAGGSGLVIVRYAI